MTTITVQLRDLARSLAQSQPATPPGELPPCWEHVVDSGLHLVGRGSGEPNLPNESRIPDDVTGPRDLAAVVREFGAGAVSTPLIETATGGAILPAGSGADLGLPTVVIDESGGRDPAAPVRVPWGRHATAIVLVTPENECRWVPSSQARMIEPAVNLAGEPSDLMVLGRGSACEAPFAVQSRLDLLWSAALCGVADATLQRSVEYVASREQFGAPLIKLAPVRTALATARSALYLAECAVERCLEPRMSAVDAEPSALAARILSAEAATEVRRVAHQLHGALGTTAEFGLGRHTRLLACWRDAGRMQVDAERRLGRLAQEYGEAGLWDRLTS